MTSFAVFPWCEKSHGPPNCLQVIVFTGLASFHSLRPSTWTTVHTPDRSGRERAAAVRDRTCAGRAAGRWSPTKACHIATPSRDEVFGATAPSQRHASMSRCRALVDVAPPELAGRPGPDRAHPRRDRSGGDSCRRASRRRRGTSSLGASTERARDEQQLERKGARRITALVAYDAHDAGAFWDAAGYPQDTKIGRRVRNLPLVG